MLEHASALRFDLEDHFPVSAELVRAAPSTGIATNIFTTTAVAFAARCSG
jgi:hypothetical protein